MSELLFRQDLFKGRTVRVHSVSRVEAMVEMEFGVSVTRMFMLETTNEEVPQEEYERAFHCLVVLIGGKRLIVQPDPADRDNWAHRGTIPARAYLSEKTYGRQVGHTYGLSEDVDPVLEIAPFFAWIKGRGFQIDDVKAAINVGRRN